MKTAIVNVADTGPLESIVVMLRSIGYQCYLPDAGIRAKLREIGCDTVLEINGLVKNWGYEHPFRMPDAGLVDMLRKDVVFIDVKAQRNYQYIVKQWPNLNNRVLWYRINGGSPEHVIRADGFDCGDEINPPCPILTPNLWYRDMLKWYPPANDLTGCHDVTEWAGRAYTCYPPFYRFNEYYPVHRRPIQMGDGFSKPERASPICLIHNLNGWGYGALVDNMRKMGVKCYGVGSPDGLINHKDVPRLLSRALCMVHLKSNDAPGYALYEALAAACPIVCTRRLIWRCRMDDLYISQRANEKDTCLVFDRETHDSLTLEDVERCTEEVWGHIQTLKDPEENARIGTAGREQLAKVMWSENNQEDKDSLDLFMRRHFG